MNPVANVVVCTLSFLCTIVSLTLVVAITHHALRENGLYFCLRDSSPVGLVPFAGGCKLSPRDALMLYAFASTALAQSMDGLFIAVVTGKEPTRENEV